MKKTNNKLISFINTEFKNPKTPKIIFGTSAIIILFFIAFKAPLDPDLFWHLKTGELIWQYKTIPSIDWYSFTMSGFPWINHEWLTEILMFLIKKYFGWEGLSLFFAAIVAFVFAWLVPQISRDLETKKYPFYTCFVFSILGAIVSSLVFGLRPQVLTLLGTALIFYIIRECQINNNTKIIYLLPVLFLLWTNMHASFILGFGILGVYLALDKSLALPAARHPDADWIKLYRPLPPKIWRNFSILSLLSFIATFINPYGPKIYIEIIRTFTDNYGHNIIIEWLSPNFHNSTEMLFAFYLILLFIILNITKKMDVLSFVLLPLLLFLSLQSSRSIAIFVLASLPILIRSMQGFEDIFSSVVQKKYLIVPLCFALVIVAANTNEISEVFRTMHNENKLAKYANFPNNEAMDFFKNYIRENKTNAFTDYLWGGYLIYNTPCKMLDQKMRCDEKIFIDGRMPHWITPEKHILKDYIDVTNLEINTQNILDKYQIGVIFTNKNLLLGRNLRLFNEWKKIYEDDMSIIYERN